MQEGNTRVEPNDMILHPLSPLLCSSKRCRKAILVRPSHCSLQNCFRSVGALTDKLALSPSPLRSYIMVANSRPAMSDLLAHTKVPCYTLSSGHADVDLNLGTLTVDEGWLSIPVVRRFIDCLLTSYT